jgi:nucleotide-binding universal stress UspA family protein
MPADEPPTESEFDSDSESDSGSDTRATAIREPPRVLVPVEVLEGEAVSEALAAFLAPSAVVLLGYHVLPEQTPTEQASMQFEDRAQAALAAIAETFRSAGRDVETRIVFTHDRDQTVERVASEIGATAVLLPNPAGELRDVLVPIRGAVDPDRLADLLATLLVGGDGTVTLWGVTKPGADFEVEAAVAETRELLVERGMATDRMLAEATASESPVREIVERSADYDVVVMGRGGEPVYTALFGDPSERVAGGAVAPVLVVRDREVE